MMKGAPMALANRQTITPGRSPANDNRPTPLQAASEIVSRAHQVADLLTQAAGAARRMRAVKAGVTTKPKFRSLGEQVLAIGQAEQGGEVDPRLVRAPAGANVGNPTAGGFLIQDNFVIEILQSVYQAAILAPLCDFRVTDHPMREAKIPGISETSRADGSRNGGALSYWAGESDTVSATYPRFRNVSFTPRKLMSLCYASNELMQDAALFDAHVRKVFADELAFKLDWSIISGTGVGMPLGFLNSTALVTVAKDVGQTAGTITSTNVASMWKRLPISSRRRAVWLCHEDVEEQLATLNTATAGGNAVVYAYPGVGGDPWPRLNGRPLIAIEQASALGAVGDLSLVDLSQYVTISAAANVALSLHLRFDTDEAVFRITQLIDGKPIWSSPITPYVGSTTRSPFVTLAARP